MRTRSCNDDEARRHGQVENKGCGAVMVRALRDQFFCRAERHVQDLNEGCATNRGQ